MKELFSALVKARAEMSAPKKNSNNPFHKSKYAALDEIVDVSSSALAKHGLMVVQTPKTIEGGVMALHTQIIHESGQSLDCGFYALPSHGGKNPMQEMGSNITYARRYALAAILGLAAENDDDGNGATPRQPTNLPAAPPVVTPAKPPTVSPKTTAKEQAIELIKTRLLVDESVAGAYCADANNPTSQEIDAIIADIKTHGLRLGTVTPALLLEKIFPSGVEEVPL